ncbi:MAG: hypothetical protein E7365_07470 [Clostridiales bacterium]|nr:hypothetical protein [Clostridiales bacterium]
MCLNKEDQLCWDCQNALGRCPWSARGEEVEGWTAEKTLIPNGCDSEYTESYKITKCPMFIKDEERLPIVLPGDRITIKTLATILGIKPRTLKSWQDEKIVTAAEKGGISVEILRKNIRTVKVKKIIRKTENALL